MGKGSVFSYDLHLRQGVAEKELHHVENVSLQGIRALVVDDYAPSCEVLLKGLEGKGLFCDGVASIEAARAKLLEALKQGRQYEFVVLDYKIGSDSGLQFCHEIKSEKTLGNPLVVIVSAFGKFASLGRLAESGASGFLVKPFYPYQLEVILKLLWDAKTSGKTLPVLTRHTLTEALSPQGKGFFDGAHVNYGHLRVLVVEDMPVNRLLLTKVLDKHGCYADVAANGLEAVRAAQDGDYDIIFMDCQMPEMDGYTATGEIRKAEEGGKRRTAIIALTADAMTGDRERCLGAGMDDYIGKPFKPEQVAAMLDKWGCAAAKGTKLTTMEEKLPV
jgi:CheY-like chemotaxis protein